MLYSLSFGNVLALTARVGTWCHMRRGLVQRQTTRQRVVTQLEQVSLLGVHRFDRFYRLECSLHRNSTNGVHINRDDYAVTDEDL
jgi:hypothetical protein